MQGVICPKEGQAYTAAEIYLVSALVVDDANEQERACLNQLAHHLQIPSDLALQIEAQVKSPS